MDTQPIMPKYSSQINQEEKEPGSFQLIFTLGVAGFVSGIILVLVYLFTLPIIENNKAIVIEKAIFKVLPGCVSFKTLILENGSISEYIPDEDKQQSKQQAANIAYMGFNEDGTLIGFALPGSEAGFQDRISAIIGYDAGKKTIIGFEVLECKETPGLGDKIIKDPAFLNNFKNLLTIPEITFVKKGEKNRSFEVEGITGATISSKAIIRLLNNVIKMYKHPIDSYVEANLKNDTEN